MIWSDADTGTKVLKADRASCLVPLSNQSSTSVKGSVAAVDWTLATLQHIPDLVCAKDLQGRIMTANRAMASRFGSAHPDELIGKTVFDLLPTDIAQDLSECEARVIRSGKPEFDCEKLIGYPNGDARWIEISRIPVSDDNHAVVGILSIFHDINDRKQSELLMLAQANLFDMVAQPGPLSNIFEKIVSVIENHLPQVAGSIHLLAPDGNSFRKTTSTTVSSRYPELLDDDNAAVTMRIALSAIAGAEPVIVPDIRVDPLWCADPAVGPSGGIRAFWSSPIFSNESQALGVLNLHSSTVAAPTDIQIDLIAMASHMVSAAIERKEAEERNKFLASHDTLTSLPNRMMFEERLASVLESARQNGSCVGLAFFDLDNFKLVNDSLGHGAGDELLKIVADRAKGATRRDGLVARLGGDEFVVFLTATSDQADRMGERFSDIRRMISTSVSLNSRTLQVTCSMGVAFFPNHALTSSDLIACADAAMYRAKRFGRDNIQYFTKDMADVVEDRLVLNTELRDAIVKGEFVLHFQPQVDLHSNRIFAAEALVRWHHPARGFLAPGEFIRTAEETGLIVPIGDWVLFTACQQNKAWQDAGFPPIVVTVNVSARQFREPDWVGRVAAILEQVGLDACFLELELTESLIMQDMAMAVGKLRELERLGVQLAIDDFGTGYSSLSVLKSLPVRRLKIDRSFVADILHDENDKALTAAIIVMAQTLKLRTIAEGVETAAQVEFLRDHHCVEAQGHFYSKPIAAGEFEALMAINLGHSSALAASNAKDDRADRGPA